MSLVNKLTALVLITLLYLTGCSAPEDPPPASPTAVAVAPAQPAVDEVIAFEMAGSFAFFWEQANAEVGSPGYGLIRDRYPGSPGVASIAAVGFGLTAYAVGVDQGYITFEQGFDRASGTLDTLLAMDRVEGFYYHFVNMNTAKRVMQSEVSTIDTAILVIGALAAGEYFGGEVQQKAAELYRGINWPWFIDEERQMFHMAYRPETGYLGHWDYYAEQLMLYVLAAGSETHPIDDSAYYTFNRPVARYGDGEPFIHSWFGSLFTYQYSHAWIDFRGYADARGADWFQNSVDASLAHVAFATDMDEQFQTLGPDAWGLTACDGPGGYNGLYGAPPSGSNNTAHLVDDTVPPAGAIGSIIFVPEHAQRAMLNYYSIARLKGEYGFRDAYNLTAGWYAPDVIAIDKGISLLTLANHQNDLVHRITMQNQQILDGLQRLGIKKTDNSS